MAIHVVQSQRMQVLLHALQTRSLAARQSPLQLLQAQHCIVPNVAVQHWLKRQLSEQLGICAHWQFHLGIRSFQWYAYQQVLPEKDRVRKANMPRLMMKWRIYQHLQQVYAQHFWQPHAQNITVNHPLQPLLQPVAARALALPTTVRADKIHNLLYWLAEQISNLFSHYVIYRGQCQQNCPPPCRCVHNWLQQWGDGLALPLEQLWSINHSASDPAVDVAKELANLQQLEAWQAELWRALFHHDWLEMQYIDQQFWQQLNAASADQPHALTTLPEQLTVFTLSELAPSQLNFLRRLGQHIDILILHFNPSQEYWADTVDANWKKQYDLGVKQRYLKQHPQASDADLAAFFAQFTLYFNAELRESRHPLLTRFGKQARDHFSLLANLSAGDEGRWVDAFVDDFPPTLLGQVQRDILYLNDAKANSYALSADDDSIQVHLCHSSLRQLEVLKDQVLHWLSQDNQRSVSDIVVLTPHLKQLEPLIRSVFVNDPKQVGYLPIKIAGVAPIDHVQAWQAICGRMQLLQGRFQPQQLADWLSLPASMQRYQLDATRIDRMLQLLSNAGFRRGFDAAHLQQSLDPNDHDYRFSFQFALNRLALGMAIPEHRCFADTLSFAEVNRDDFELIAGLMAIFNDLNARRNWLHVQHSVDDLAVHLQRILAEIDEFMAAEVEHLHSVREQAQKLWRMYGLATVNNQSQLAALKHLRLPLAAVLDELSANLETQFEQASPTGFMTFAEIGQLRPLPYPLMIILNLDSGHFPSRQRHSAFDLMRLLRPQLGDRSRLEDDQGAFLDALLLAEQQLWLFYNGFDVADGEVRDPSMLLQELLEHLSFIVEHDGELALAATADLDGLSVPLHLAALYRVHALQPFDAVGFQAAQRRYQDQWYRVAKQLQGTTEQRQSPLLSQHTKALARQLTPDADLNNVQVLDAREWIGDVLFPARVYLKQLGVRNIQTETDYADQEALLLDGLARHRLRDYVLTGLTQTLQHSANHSTNDPTNDAKNHTANAFNHSLDYSLNHLPLNALSLSNPLAAVANSSNDVATSAPLDSIFATPALDLALLQDQLPVGKMQYAALSRVQQEYLALYQRMQPYGAQPTETTQKTWRCELPQTLEDNGTNSTELWFNLTVPVYPASHLPKASSENQAEHFSESAPQNQPEDLSSPPHENEQHTWLSVHASAGRGRRRAQIWLEYLLWCVWQAQHLPHLSTEKLRRVAVFNDVTVICQGVTATQAQAYLATWLAAWRYAQQQILLLPAELLMQLAKPNEQPEWQPEDHYHRPSNLDALLKIWHNNYSASGFDLRDKEDSYLHRDWQFLLQYRNDQALLTQACLQFAHDLYQPIFAHLTVESA